MGEGLGPGRVREDNYVLGEGDIAPGWKFRVVGGMMIRD